MPRRPRQGHSTSSMPITSSRWLVAIAAPARRSASAASAEPLAPSEICLASVARSLRLAPAERIPSSTVSPGMPWDTPIASTGSSRTNKPMVCAGRGCGPWAASASSARPGRMQDVEYWAVLAYLLKANGLLPPGTALDSATAAQTPLDR